MYQKRMKSVLKTGPPVRIFHTPYIRTQTLRTIPVEKWTSQILYMTLIKTVLQTPTSFEKWPLSPDEQLDLIEKNYHITSSTKILDTQYRIQHRFYHTQSQLDKWRLASDSTCLSCGEVDTLEHHFMLCSNKLQFWNNLKIWKKETLI